MDTREDKPSVTLKQVWRGLGPHQRATAVMLALALYGVGCWATSGMLFFVGFLGLLAILIYMLVFMLVNGFDVNPW